MKVSEIKQRDLVLFGRLDDPLPPDYELLERMYLPAAKAHIAGYTGMEEAAMDGFEDLTVAVCTLALHFYENRSMTQETMQENRTVMAIIGKYDSNLLPHSGEGSA